MSVLSVADVRTVSPEHSSPRSQQAVRSRPALQVLPKVKGRQKGLIAGVILLLAAALAAVLALNIHIANAQYSVVQMQNEHQSLVHQNQALTQQAAALYKMELVPLSLPPLSTSEDTPPYSRHRQPCLPTPYTSLRRRTRR